MIRPATAADAQRLADLINHWVSGSTITFNPVPRTAQDITAMIADKAAAGHAVLLAETGGAVLGYATYGQFRAGLGYAHAMEHSIALSPDARGRGVGRALLRAVEDHARAAGAHVMLAGVSGENAEGRAFHTAMGYAVVAVIPQVGRKFDRWLDLVLMQKFLS